MSQDEETWAFNRTRHFLNTLMNAGSIRETALQEHLRTEYLSRLTYLTEREARSTIDFCVFCGKSYKKLLRFRLRKDASHKKSKTLKLVCSTCKHLNKFKLIQVSKAKRLRKTQSSVPVLQKNQSETKLASSSTQKETKTGPKINCKSLLEQANAPETQKEPQQLPLNKQIAKNNSETNGKMNQFSFYYLTKRK